MRQREEIKQRRDEQHAMLVLEQQKSEHLLHNRLPARIARRLKRDAVTIANGHTDVTVLFADIINFTRLTEELSPRQMVALLNRFFPDSICGRPGQPACRLCSAIAELALEMNDLASSEPEFRAHRIGIHVGISTGGGRRDRHQALRL